MKYFIIAGEASGDLHGANLVKSLKEKGDHQISGWGGDLMEAQGVNILKHYRELAFMGFAEVVANIRTILRNFKTCKEQIERFKPDVLILIDYPGFNLRMAKYAKSKNIKVVYYISPQIWAWKQSRVHQIKENVDRMITILPFEADFYKRFDYEVDYVGHPLLDAVDNFRKSGESSIRDELKIGDEKVIAVLPGSRSQEIKSMLPIMLKTLKKLEGYRVIVAGAPSKSAGFYDEFLNGETLVQNRTYELLQIAEFAFVTSGTATLETAIFNVPQVVCYKANKISYVIAKQLIKVKYISLVNLILDSEAVTELIQGDLNEKRLLQEAEAIRKGGAKRSEILASYEELNRILGGGGASDRAALSVLKA